MRHQEKQLLSADISFVPDREASRSPNPKRERSPNPRAEANRLG